MNFLVLTPDGVGSTYLQKALTVYLNASGKDYYNSHELLNGLELDNNKNLYKVMKGYRQSLEEICGLLDANEGNIISRLAQYHVENRQTGQIPKPPKGVLLRGRERRRISFEVAMVEHKERNSKEDYIPFYKKCNSAFHRILYCVRDPFEYSLSWSIRDITGKFNVFSMEERIETHGAGDEYKIDLDFMRTKLEQYNRYLYWVKDNFPNAIKVEYNDLHKDVDLVLSDITGSDYSMKNSWGFSLQEYSTLLYKMSSFYNPKLEYSDKLMRYQKELIQSHKLYREGMPIKMNTLSDKSKCISNFLECLDTYNDFANSSNEFPNISQFDIYKLVAKENKIYEH